MKLVLPSLLLGIAAWFSACTAPLKPIPVFYPLQTNSEGDTVYHVIPPFRFVDQDSAIITEATFEDHIYVADFFFTTCPSICPKMSKQMLRVHDAFLDQPGVLLLSHSIDPGHDSVAVLRDYAQGLGIRSSKWHLVTGDMDTIHAMAQHQYKVSAMQDEDAPGGYLHSGAFILVDKERRIRGYYDGTIPEEVDLLIRDIRRLLDEDENP
ncbi:MAG: SCO family protein [Bacteroidia bacterium]